MRDKFFPHYTATTRNTVVVMVSIVADTIIVLNGESKSTCLSRLLRSRGVALGIMAIPPLHMLVAYTISKSSRYPNSATVTTAR